MNDKTMEMRLNEVLKRAVENKEAAGINLLILKDGKEIAYTEAGFSNMEAKKPFERDAILRMYSMSKPITGAAVMLLVERGLISLGESVSKYLSGFKDLKINMEDGTSLPVGRQIFIRDLMSMTSGLPYGYSEGCPTEQKVQKLFDKIDEKLYTDDALNTVDIANALGEIGVMFRPGDYWQYGTSADVLGAIVEVVTGMRFGDFLKKEFFEPLDMKDTAFFVPMEKQERLAEAYERKDGELHLFKTNHLGLKYMRTEDPHFQSGGAGLCSTIDDYSHFAMMLINNGSYNGKQILSPATVKYMTHGRLTPWQQKKMWYDWDGHAGYSYGCLMQHMIEPEMSYFNTYMDEYGWDGWLGTYFCNSPSNGLSIIMGMQISNPDGNTIFEKVRNTLATLI